MARPILKLLRQNPPRRKRHQDHNRGHPAANFHYILLHGCLSLFFIHNCFRRCPRYCRGWAVNLLLLFDAVLGKLCFARPSFIRTQTWNDSKSGADALIADDSCFLNAIPAVDRNLPTPAAGCSPRWTGYLYYDARERLSVNWPLPSPWL